MRSFKYVGECAAGFVEFTMEDRRKVRMHEGEAVEVPDSLAAKLANNPHFEEVKAKPAAEKKADKGKGAKKDEGGGDAG